MRIIAGIDPGMTIGVACLDFRGSILKVVSSKNMSLGDVIKVISDLGDVSVISSDVTPSPHFLQKLSANFDCVLFVPENSLPVEEKINITKNYHTDDAHQRDALAAALNAFNKLKNKFERIDSYIYNYESENLEGNKLKPGDADLIKHLVLKGVSLNAAFEQVTSSGTLLEACENFGEGTGQDVKSPANSREISRLIDLNKSLKDNIAELKEAIGEKDRKIGSLEDEVLNLKRTAKAELMEDEGIKRREQIIKSFEYGMSDLKVKFNKMLDDSEKLREITQDIYSGRIIPVPFFPQSCAGASVIKRKLKKGEQDSRNFRDIDVLFSEKPGDRADLKFLDDSGTIIKDIGEIENLLGIYYIEKEKVEKIKHDARQITEGDLDDIIKNYRKRRLE